MSNLTNFVFILISFHSITDFEFAQYTTVRDRQYLMLGGNRYAKNNSNNCGRVYWRCIKYYTTRCKSRAMTQLVDGYDMAKVTHIEHNHGTWCSEAKTDWNKALSNLRN